tara:strand:- start:154 stop:621 length:468 start_codon:yes stop_codon:yes gene_type:complete
MSLPRPRSIFDEVHPLADTGLTYTISGKSQYVLGIVLVNAKTGDRRVIMRGGDDPENDAVVESVTKVSKGLVKWINDHKFITVKEGVAYDTRNVNLPKMATVRMGGVTAGLSVEGRITSVTRPLEGPSESWMTTYHCFVTVDGDECRSVVEKPTY